jgi:hypothetical protein
LRSGARTEEHVRSGHGDFSLRFTPRWPRLMKIGVVGSFAGSGITPTSHE